MHLTVLGFCLGIWIARDDQILVSSVDVPQDIVGKWAPRCTRCTYINLLELLAVALLAFSAPDILEDRDVLWFLDIQAAWRSIIRSACVQCQSVVTAHRAALRQTALQPLV